MLSTEVSSAAPVWPRVSTAPLSTLAAQSTPLPVAVLGAGPVGLAAVAKLIERNLPFVVLEANERVGANLLDYGHVQLFSPWQYNVDPTMAKLLQPTGWQHPEPSELPLAGDIARRVLQPFAQLPQVAAGLHLRTRVVSVSREGYDKVKSKGRESAPFIIRAMRDGKAIELRARAVIDSTGTWNTPNPVGASGLPAIGEREAAPHVFYGIPDVLGVHRARYAGKKTLVVGAGHSAANALLALAELAKQVPGTRLVWSVRSPVLTRVFGGGDADALPARGALGASLRRLRDTGALEFNAGLRITEIIQEGGKVLIAGIDGNGESLRIDGVDEIICATGQRPDLSLTSELRVKLDPWLESNEALGPLIDPNEHSCGTVRPHGHRELSHPEPGLYTVGVKSYGRAPTFLMATGFEQARSVVAAIAGDLEAADRVELSLPETGVCGVGESRLGRGRLRCRAADRPKPERRATTDGMRRRRAPAAPRRAACRRRQPQSVDAVASGCCGGPAKADASACCVLDEHMKSQGAVGCGCSRDPRARAATCCG